jgi:hypothetical protein
MVFDNSVDFSKHQNVLTRKMSMKETCVLFSPSVFPNLKSLTYFLSLLITTCPVVFTFIGFISLTIFYYLEPTPCRRLHVEKPLVNMISTEFLDFRLTWKFVAVFIKLATGLSPELSKFSALHCFLLILSSHSHLDIPEDLFARRTTTNLSESPWNREW